ncbi:MAG: FtsH protease activity modulator HflK [Desulfarculus sp.]|nr:MAG: FtsH protease activity modulator HflK [Desulfarculus sp.]
MPMDWTPPPRGTGGEPDISKVLQEFKQRMPSFKQAKGLWVVVLIIAAIALGSTSYYTVGPEETGIVLRFGRLVRETGPGLHFKLPLGVEQALTVKTGRVFKEEFGFRGIAPGVRSRFTEKGYGDESLMLSGDLNVIEVKWIVQYKIKEPKLWLFAVRDPVAAIRDLSESVMRQIVGNSLSDQVLTLQRTEIAIQAQKKLQEILSAYKTGVQIITVKLQDVNPPLPVQPAFNEVNEARQQQERMINEAQEAYNREIPKALGEASRVVTEAEGYATEKINRAQGQAKRFLDVLKSYLSAQEVTKRRLYLEAMERILKNSQRVYVVDENVKGLLPHLSLRPTPPAAAGKEVKP